MCSINSKCPIKPLLPTGTLMPNSSNQSTKMIQSKKIKNSIGKTFYNNHQIIVDISIGSIQYIKKVNFYYKSTPLPFHHLNWNSYGETYTDSIELAAIYLTLLSNKKIPNSVIFPFYFKDNSVYALGLQNGSIIQYMVNPADAYFYAYYKNA
jgi:hypothetical protein